MAIFQMLNFRTKTSVHPISQKVNKDPFYFDTNKFNWKDFLNNIV